MGRWQVVVSIFQHISALTLLNFVTQIMTRPDQWPKWPTSTRSVAIIAWGQSHRMPVVIIASIAKEGGLYASAADIDDGWLGILDDIGVKRPGDQFNWISTDCSTGFSTERLATQGDADEIVRFVFCLICQSKCNYPNWKLAKKRQNNWFVGYFAIFMQVSVPKNRMYLGMTRDI